METDSVSFFALTASLSAADDPQLVVDVNDNRDWIIEALDALALQFFSRMRRQKIDAKLHRNNLNE
jgi:hypothetical protein